MKRSEMIEEVMQAMLSADGMTYSDYRRMLQSIFLNGTRGLSQMSDAELQESYAQWCGEEEEIEEEGDNA